jgi:M6 family metalloprotease-like protein
MNMRQSVSRPRIRGHWARHRARRPPLAALLIAVAAAVSAAPANATIVWEGHEVPAWPDLPVPSPPPSGYQAVATNINLFPHPSGVVKGLTILVDFSDQASAYSKEEIDAWLNQSGYNKFGLKGSIRDYYLGQSNGKVDYQNEVHGFYRAKKPKSYYQGGTSYERADELWAEVVAALDAEIDFSLFDNDKDGKTEAISLLYAGGEGEFGKGLWPHAGSSSERRDGVRLNRYMMTALNNQPTNYVFSHESGHMLFGWPDLYGVGDYCIMGNRGSDTNPVGINDMFRADQGWIEIVDVTESTNARYSSAPDGVAYRFLNPARPSEYFLWSNVQNTAEWASLRGGGLLVWHFDNSIRGNNPPAKLELAVVQATEGSRALGATQWPSPGSAAGDLYSKATKAELAATTSPSSAWNSGSASGLRVYDVSASGPTMEFSVGTGTIAPDGGTGGSNGSSGAGGSGGPGGSGGGATSGGKSSAGGIGGATGGKSSGGGAGKSSNGGTSATGGSANVSGSANLSGSANASGGSDGSGASGSGGSGGSGGGAPVGTAGTTGTASSGGGGGGARNAGGNTSSTGGASSGSNIGNTGAENDAGCTCRVGPGNDQRGAGLLALCTTIGAGVLRRRRRR